MSKPDPSPEPLSGHPAAAGLDPLGEILRHTLALADAAEGHLELPVPSCPGWVMFDLVHHLWEVQWFWRTIAAGPLSEPPPEDSAPARPCLESLIPELRDGARLLVETLAAADPSTPAWTWASQRDIAFITRHQIQEAAVHHWDAEHALGHPLELGAGLAIDAIEEFLTFSLVSASAEDTGGPLVLVASDAPASWTITLPELAPGGTPDKRRAEVVRGAHGDDTAVLEATASQLLLWLYGRIELVAAGPAGPARSAALQRHTSTE